MKTIKCLGNNEEDNLHDLGYGDPILDTTLMTQPLKK